MLRMFAVCVGAALVWAASALGYPQPAPQLVQNDNGDAALVFDILAQRRPAQATSATSGGAFGPLTQLTPTPTPNGLLQPQQVAIDDHGGAVAAWTSAGPTGDSPFEAYASVRPSGGDFGPPQRLSEGDHEVSETQVDVNPRGDAIVTWRAPAPRFSIRPAGGSFSAQAAVPGPGIFDRTVVLEADGGALFMGDDGPGGKPFAIYRRPDGTFEQPVALDPVPTLATSKIAANRRGDVLIAWGENGRVRALERPAGGSFGAPETVATGNDLGGVRAAAINDAGDAAITLTSPWLITRSHGGVFGPPQPRPPVADTPNAPATDTLAMNERGDLAIAWVEPVRRVMAVYRPAGGAVGAPLLLGVAPFLIHGGAEPPLAPALALDGAGTATAIWEDPDGETVAIRARHFGAAGLGSAETVATPPSFVQEAPPEACVPAGSKVLARSGRAVVTQQTSSPFFTFGCLLARGVQVNLAHSRLISDLSDGGAPPIAVAGPFTANLVGAYGHNFAATYMSISDLRDEWSGQSRAGPAAVANIATVPIIRLKRDGSAAWVACPPGRKGARGYCRRGSKRIKEVYAFGLSRDLPYRVGYGAKIDPASLRIGTDRVWWRNGGRRRSAPLG